MTSSKTTSGKPTVVQWPIRKLKPHPAQAILFDNLPDPQLEDLATSMRENGLLHPVDVLPDGTVIGGHQRWLAALRLGWREIDVRVHGGLGAPDAPKVQVFLIEDNLRRRQMGPVDLARCYRQFQEFYRHSLPTKSGAEREDLRDLIGRHMGKSGRQLDRYVRLLDLPRPIQKAVSERKLPASTAEKFLGLSRGDLQRAAQAMERGANPRNVAKQFLPDGPVRHFTGHALDLLLARLSKSIPDLEGRTGELSLKSDQQRELLLRAMAVIGELLKHGAPQRVRRSGRNVRTASALS